MSNPNVLAVFYQPPGDDGVNECLVVEVAGGPKRYMRIWTNQPDPCIEWGWQLHESAVKIYED